MENQVLIHQDRKWTERFDAIFKEHGRLFTAPDYYLKIDRPTLFYLMYGRSDYVSGTLFHSDGKVVYSGHGENIWRRSEEIDEIHKRAGSTNLYKAKDGHLLPFETNLSRLGVTVRFLTDAFLFLDGVMFVISSSRNDTRCFGLVNEIFEVDVYSLLSDEETLVLVDKFFNSLLWVPFENPVREKKPRFYLTSHSKSYGFKSAPFDLVPLDGELMSSYNDDLPYERMKELLSDKHPRLLMFSGVPGTGKTSLIKRLIGDLPKVRFYYLDPSLLSNVTDQNFINYLLDLKNCVIVMEDCEKLLANRESGNPMMNVMLNLTDGFLGEALGVKFICTFNCSESTVDKALLRKGRLSLRYEFKPLCLEKCKKIWDGATCAMTLADLYNHEESNGVVEEKKIGFNR